MLYATNLDGEWRSEEVDISLQGFALDARRGVPHFIGSGLHLYKTEGKWSWETMVTAPSQGTMLFRVDPFGVLHGTRSVRVDGSAGPWRLEYGEYAAGDFLGAPLVERAEWVGAIGLSFEGNGLVVAQDCP